MRRIQEIKPLLSIRQDTCTNVVNLLIRTKTMNVIEKFYDALPPYWRNKIKTNNWFKLNQFSSSIKVSFEDGSYCYFNYAFAVEANNQLAVFTEHCGYFIFLAKGITWKEVKPKRTKLL